MFGNVNVLSFGGSYISAGKVLEVRGGSLKNRRSRGGQVMSIDRKGAVFAANERNNDTKNLVLQDSGRIP